MLYSAIGLFVVVFVMLLGLALFSKPDYKSIHSEISELANVIHEQYRKRPDYWGLATKQIIKSGSVPEKMLRSGKIFSSIGREVLIGGNNSGDAVMPAGRQFMLSMDNISRTVCVELAQNVAELTANPALDFVQIENESGTYQFSWSGENSFLNLPKKAADICANRNVFSWIFN